MNNLSGGVGLFLMLFMAMMGGKDARGQGCNCGVINGLPTYPLYGCPGVAFNVLPSITYGYTIIDYSWSPSTGITPNMGTTLGWTSVIPPTVCTVYTLTVNELKEEIANGNFGTTAGTMPTGFTTGYTLGNVGYAGYYNFATNARFVDSAACSFTDHTTGTGYMMVINGADSTLNLLHGVFNLCCNTAYHFSIWGATWYGTDTAVLAVTINGVAYPAFAIPSTCGLWAQYTVDFTTPACSSDTENVSINIIDINVDKVGNDFALDDISLTKTCTATATLSVCPQPVITGPTHVCIGATITLVDSASYGIWSTGNYTIATIDSTGIVTGISAGVDTISFTNFFTGCSVTYVITVNPLPTVIASAIPLSICAGATTTLNADDGVPGSIYVWTTTDPSISCTVCQSPTATPLITTTYSVTVTDTNGCKDTASVMVTINPTPAPIAGPSTVCTGTTISLTDAVSGGTWSSSNTSIATIDATGTVTGIASGIAIITYAMGSTAATTCFVIDTITVLQSPTIVFQGARAFCVNGSTSIDVTPGGGTFSISGGATISSTFYGSSWAVAIVTSAVAGVSTLTYTVTVGSCTSVGTINITVYPAPSVSVSPTLSLYCSVPVNLTATATGGSGGYTYNWLPVTGLSANNTPTVTVSGISSNITYTVTVTDSATGCTATDTSEVIVPCKEICSSQCSKNISLLGHTGTFAGGTVATGSYYVDNNFTITANTTFMGAVVAIKPGITITIAAGVNVIIGSSHFFCCANDTMWKGFLMQTIGTNTATMDIGKTSLIEDAKIAVNYSNASITSGVLFNSHGTVFNRCWYGLYIANFASTTASTQFTMTNTVFTSRDFSQYQNPATLISYPCAWPDPANDLKAGYTQPSQVYLAMNIDNPTGMPTSSGNVPYTKIGCKTAITTGLDALTGIYIQSVGPATSTTFPGLTVAGGSTSNVNAILFDNMNYGIYAVNSNLLVTGCYFAHIHPHIVGGSVVAYNGDGIYATKAAGSSNLYQLSVNNLGAAVVNDASNYFYNCKNAVEVISYNSVIANANNIYSDHTTAFIDANNGVYGYKITTNTTNAYTITANYNNIVNITNGIAFTSNNENINGTVGIYNNNIIASPYDYTAGYTVMGISANNLTTSTSYVPNGSININNNVIEIANNGIYVNNFMRLIAVVQNNNVNIVQDLYVTPGSPQYGIHYCKSSGIYVVGNYVAGTTASYATLTYMNGICAESDNKANTTCNTVVNVYRGFWFMGNPNLHSFWGWNTMQNNHFGMHLDKSIIGAQGVPTSPSDNVWAGTWPSGTYQTMVTSPTATTSSNQSVLTVRPGTGSYDPSPNTGALLTYRYYHPYSLTSTTTGGSTHTCLPVRRGERSTGSDDTDVLVINSAVGLYEYQLTHTDTIGGSGLRVDTVSADGVPEMNWIAQMGIYTALQIDTALVDSSAILHQFATMAANSRYARLAAIENQIVLANYDTARGMMTDLDAYMNTNTDSATGVVMADGVGANDVVDNYVAYFNLYMKYMQDTLTTTDSAALQALAALCPITNGTIIYEARALYSRVFNENPTFINSCGNDTSGARSGADSKYVDAADNPLQHYSLYPNPNNGKLMLMQYILDTQPIQIDVYNAMGSKVVTINNQFAQYTLPVTLTNQPPGLYLLRITNYKNHSFNLKFVKK